MRLPCFGLTGGRAELHVMAGDIMRIESPGGVRFR